WLQLAIGARGAAAHFVKVDGSMLEQIERDDRKQRLVELLVLFAKATGTQLVVEGIETEEEAGVVTRMGADLLQVSCAGGLLPARLRLVGRRKADLLDLVYLAVAHLENMSGGHVEGLDRLAVASGQRDFGDARYAHDFHRRLLHRVAELRQAEYQPRLHVGDPDAARLDALDVIEAVSLQLRPAAHRADCAGTGRCRWRVAGRLHAILAAHAVLGKWRVVAIRAHQCLIVARPDLQ